MLYRIFTLLILLLAAPAWGADWYVRPSSGEYGDEDGTSYAAAFDGWDDITWGVGGVSAGDTLYICGAHTYDSEKGIGDSGATSGNETIISGACPGDPGSLTFSASFISNSRSHFRFNDFTLTAASGGTGIWTSGAFQNVQFNRVTFSGGAYPINFDVSVNFSNITFDGCTFTGKTDAGSGAIQIYFSDAGHSGVFTNITIQNCTFTSGAGYGIHIRSTAAATDADVNSLTISGNTFSSMVVGAIRVFGEGEFDASAPALNWTGAVITNNTINNCGFGITLGGFGAADYGTNYISGNTISNTSHISGGMNIFYNKYLSIFENTLDTGITSTVDGCGILIDYGNENLKVYKNLIKNFSGDVGAPNSGAAIMVLDSKTVSIFANIGDGNKSGIYYGDTGTFDAANTPAAITVYGNTFANSSDYGVYIDSSIDATEIAQLTLKNNIFIGDGSGTGIDDESGAAADAVEDYNLIYNFTDAVANHSAGAHNVTTNPLLNAAYGLQGNSPAKDAGAVLYTYAAHPGDFLGAKVYGSAPDIGAIEYKDHTFGGWFFEMFIPTIFNLCASTNANCYTQP